MDTSNASQAEKAAPRVPVSVTHIGRVTVRIYDMEAYNANIAQYYGDEEVTPARPVKNTSAPAFRKKKAAARYNWLPKGDYMGVKKGA